MNGRQEILTARLVGESLQKVVGEGIKQNASALSIVCITAPTHLVSLLLCETVGSGMWRGAEQLSMACKVKQDQLFANLWVRSHFRAL